MNKPFKSIKDVRQDGQRAVVLMDFHKYKRGQVVMIFPINGFVRVNNWWSPHGWCCWRFAPLTSASLPARAANGRFVSKQTYAGPLLKKGSIYLVKRRSGFVPARLRAVAHEDYVVLSSHNKAFLARRKNVRLATPEQVQEYLRAE